LRDASKRRETGLGLPSRKHKKRPSVLQMAFSLGLRDWDSRIAV
jgi:hypothetical protein